MQARPTCSKCGRITSKSGEHQCQSIDLRAERQCAECKRLLCSEGYERQRNLCRSCTAKRYNHLNNRTRTRERNAMRAVFGGACQRCGYSRCQAALHFHHLNSEEKRRYSRYDSGASPAEVRRHPERFQLLCANCHIEVHQDLLLEVEKEF